MPSKSSNKKSTRGNSGGRTAASEPRMQVFRDFGGCNFQESPREFDLTEPKDKEQSDLQMNFVVVQNNVDVRSNKTLATRAPLQELFPAPGSTFTDASVLIGGELYIATADHKIHHGEIGKNLDATVETHNLAAGDKDEDPGEWGSLDYYDGKLIGATKTANQLWTGDLDGNNKVKNFSNVAQLERPNIELEEIKIEARGKLDIADGNDKDHPFRISFAVSYVNKYGPTELSDPVLFYANTALAEWHSGCWGRISGIWPSDDVVAIEIYYRTGDASSWLFAGRVDNHSQKEWHFNWMGYLDATNMWPAGNLVAPTANYTTGVHASRMCEIDGRMYFWGDNDKPYRLWIGGNPGSLFSVSPGTGGGFVDIEPNSGQEIRYVDKYKTQSGNSIVTMLCDSENSTKEQRYNLVENSITISNEQNMKSWQAEQVAGAVGCKSFHGARVCEDGLYSISRYGLALTTMTMEYNSQIKTNYVSDPIKPVFTDELVKGRKLKHSVLLECDGILYMAIGKDDGNLDNIIFCYNIALKAWWTYTLDKSWTILNLIHIDWEGYTEGIGIVTPNMVYLLPTTDTPEHDNTGMVDFRIVTGELSAQQPQQGRVHLSQLEFRFDYLVGTFDVLLEGYDIFGRYIKVTKSYTHTDPVYNWTEYMRVDEKFQSYRITFSGHACFRMSHFIAKVYTLSNKIGLVWGFDDTMTHGKTGNIHPEFKSYNDIRRAVFT